MPTDMSGKYRFNHQAVAHANKTSEGREKMPEMKHEEGGEHTELHDHGDGTYHSVIEGERTEHPSIGHAVVHIAAHHEPEGLHHHTRSDGMGITSHHSEDGGEVQGPHEHGTPEEAGEHLASVINGEGEMGHHAEPDGDEGMGMAGLHSLMGMK